MAQHFTLTVVEILNETSDTITLKFKQPALRKLKYKSGQYLTLIVKIGGRTYRRPYSISSVFGLDATVNITVKVIKDGIVSNYIKNITSVGDRFEVMEPMGDFVLPDGIDDGQVVFWSGGSGITPAYSILRDCLFNSPALKIILIYCNRNKESIIYYHELKQLKRDFNDRLSILHIISSPITSEEEFYFEGRISSESVNDILKSFVQKFAYHYVCGPQGILNTVVNELKKNGVSRTHIFSENFHNSVDMAQLSGVSETTVYLDFQNNTTTFSVPLGKSILDACLDAGIDFPYSCQTGSCTFCKAKLVAGKIKIVTNVEPINKLQNDEYLLCCGYPLIGEIFLQA